MSAHIHPYIYIYIYNIGTWFTLPGATNFKDKKAGDRENFHYLTSAILPSVKSMSR